MTKVGTLFPVDIKHVTAGIGCRFLSLCLRSDCCLVIRFLIFLTLSSGEKNQKMRYTNSMKPAMTNLATTPAR